MDTQADNSDSQGRELASIKAQLFSVLRASTEHAICLTDGEFEILEINPVAEQLFRCKSADVIGGKFTDLANRIDLKLPSEKGITAVIKEMGRWESELATMDEAKPDGDSRTIYIAISGVQDQQGGGSGYVVVARDVTEQLERERNLVESQRMESVGLLAGGIAHDFNNILMGILGYASLAKDQIGKEQKAYRMVSIIEQSAERAASLTKQLLAYAQGGKLQSVPIHLDDMVTEMLEILGSNLHKNVVVKRDIAENLPFVLADPAQLQQVIMNLCLNASEAIEERMKKRDGGAGGTILLTSGVKEINGDARARFAGGYHLQPGNYVFLEVRDDGCGMDEETRRRIFEPFFTTKFTGRGLGLAAVEGIIRNHGGSLEVETEPGKGTSFTVLLPATWAKAVAPPEKPFLSLEGSETILLIDDEAVVRQLGLLTLTNLGYRVLLAENGHDGLEVYRGHQDEISLIVLDLTMPQMGGDEVLVEINNLGGNVHILLTTGFDESAVEEMGIPGVAGFLQKPYTPEVLARAVREILDRRRPGK